MDQRATHFLVLGFLNANFAQGDLVGPDPGRAVIPVEGDGVRAVPQTKDGLNILWDFAFPNSSAFDDQEFQRRLALIIQQWVKHKRVNPMLLDEETAAIRWIFIKEVPGLPLGLESIIYKMISLVRPGEYDLSPPETEYLLHVLRLNRFGSPGSGLRLPVAPKDGELFVTSIGAVDRRTGVDAITNYGDDLEMRMERERALNQRLADLIIEYKMKQMDWETSKPSVRMVNFGDDANPDWREELFFPDTEEMEQKARDKVSAKRTRFEMEQREFQRVSDIPPPPREAEVPILTSIVASSAARLRIASAELEDAEREVKRAKRVETSRIEAWNDFMRVREELGMAYLAALPLALGAGKIPEVAAAGHISRLHFEDEHYRVTPEERDQITKASLKSAYIGGIGIEK